MSERLTYEPERFGVLEIDEDPPGHITVYFTPPKDPSGADEPRARAQLLSISAQHRSLTIYPIVATRGRRELLSPKYSQVESITLEDVDFIFRGADGGLPATPEEVLFVLGELPPMFTKNYAFGLGMARPYTALISAVEAITKAKHIVISDHPTGSDEHEADFFHIQYADFEEARQAMNQIDRLGQLAIREVRSTTVYNLLAARLGLPAIVARPGRHALRRLFTAMAQGKDYLSAEDEVAVVEALQANVGQLAASRPEKLVELKVDIELVTLKRLIEQFEVMLSQDLPESRWQAFFGQNALILDMVFGFPVVKLREQASVGGVKFSGSGGKIADFLVKNQLTDNVGLFEIKRPKAPVLTQSPVRAGVYAPSSQLVGALTQVLDQRFQLVTHISALKHASRQHELETYAVHCVVVIGKTPTHHDEKKSFELFRHNSKDVQIITFDELLAKLKGICALLSDPPASSEE